MKPRRIGSMLLLWSVVVWSVPWAAQAQERDPTRAPAQASEPLGGPQDAAASLPPGLQTMPVLVRDGQPYLVVGTRLLAVGQRLDGFTLERISDAQIWLRKGKTLHKVERFAGIQRRAASSVSPAQP